MRGYNLSSNTPDPRVRQANNVGHPRLAPPRLPTSELTRQTQDQILEQLETGLSQEKIHADVAVLIPAHNEEKMIQTTIASLREQTYPVKRILVMSDNSTDRTVELAREMGVEVVETVDNHHRKGGAMNQGFALLLPTMKDTDFILGMDADGMIKPNAIEIAMEIFEQRPNLGGLSASVSCRKPHGFVETAQVLEYERGRRNMSRAKGKIHVLSGAAAFLKVSVLREVAEARGTKLPGTRGDVMLPTNIVEDYELTLAILELGYKITSSKRVQMWSDLMTTVRELEGQRMRWYRGTMETLALYGWKRYTWFTFVSIGYNLLTTVLFAVALLFIAFGYVAVGHPPDFRYLLLMPLFVAEYTIVSRLVPGRKSTLMAISFFPMFVYGGILTIIYWQSLVYAIRKRPFHWDGDFDEVTE